jgi:hypothetical protein
MRNDLLEHSRRMRTGTAAPYQEFLHEMRGGVVLSDRPRQCPIGLPKVFPTRRSELLLLVIVDPKSILSGYLCGAELPL